MVVIAIGGSASVGKTTLARELAQLLRIDRVAHVDDTRSAGCAPSFLETTPDVWTRPAAWLCETLIAETRAFHSGIAAEIEARLVEPGSGIVEGEGVEPRLLRRWDPARVRAVYVIEDDPARLHETFAQRASGARFLALAEDEQRAVVEMNRRYGAWLRREAEGHHQAWVPSQPWPTLAERALAAIGGYARPPASSSS